jgi:predicted MPP superfamily phosphohydrolase
MATTDAVPGAAVRRRSLLRPLTFAATLVVVLGLLFGVPWWSLVMAGNDWPLGVRVVGTVVFAVALVVFPVTMFLGHGRRLDWAARTGDTILGAVWILFVWAIAGDLLRLALLAGGVDDPVRSRVAAGFTAVVALGLGLWGYREAMRVPRVRRVEVRIPRLGAGLDGLKIVQLTDTHYGPIDRVAWSKGVTEVVNGLGADVVAHTGDIADGTPQQRTEQAAPLGDIRAGLARVYVTGNHEYFGEAQGWLDHMQALGWEPLHNRHIVVERGGDRLVVAGVDDRTAAGTGLAGHKADHELALDGADAALPVLLLAHQPKQIDAAVAHGIDLQISGHTHGGQMWPFHYLVRIDQPVVQGLSRHGERTQLFTSRGTGFWGPPFRIFAPSEITEITLRAGQ